MPILVFLLEIGLVDQCGCVDPLNLTSSKGFAAIQMAYVTGNGDVSLSRSMVTLTTIFHNQKLGSDQDTPTERALVS